MTIAIVGSRNFNDYNFLKKYVDNTGFIITKIVSGGASGVDSLARSYAQENKITLKEYFADWKTHGKKAGFLRNWDIVKEADWVLAFWDGESPGTKHSIDISKKLRKPLEIIKVSS